MPEISAQRLRTHLQRFACEEAAVRLAQRLGLDCDDTPETPGRLRFLHRASEAKPGLAALAQTQPAEARQQWDEFLKENRKDPRLWHGFAVMLRERVLERESSTTHSSDETAATALWCWLLCSPVFREYAAARRTASPADAAGPTITPAQQEELFDALPVDFMVRHRSLGKKHLDSGNIEGARIHLECLTACSQGADGMRPKLVQAGWPCPLPLDSAKLDKVASAASRNLDEWADGAMAEADRILKGDENKATEPDYAGATAALRKFIELGGGGLTLLRTSLAWHNQWCAACRDAKRDQAIAGIVRSGRVVAERLEPLCRPGEGLRPENAELSHYHRWRAKTENDPKQAIAAYAKAMAWNPADRHMLVVDCANQGVAQANQERWREALVLLRQAESWNEDPEGMTSIQENIRVVEREARQRGIEP
jgi:hypothetical protein